MVCPQNRSFSQINPIIRQQFLADRTVFWLNSFTLLLFLVLLTHAKVWGGPQAIQFLFHKEDPSLRPYVGFLTVISNGFWGLSVAVCAFSSGLLQRLHPQRQLDWFLLAPAVGIGVILVDEIYRVTIFLAVHVGVSKLLLTSIYGVAALLYLWFFRQRLRSTPYLLLLTAVGLIVLSRVVDLLKISAPGAPARMLLEDGSKLLGLLNLALYWWLVSQQEILRSLQSHYQRLTATLR